MRLLVVRALPGIGDWLCAVPALALLRSRHPAAEITLVALERTRPLIDRYAGLVDGFEAFPGFPGVPEEPESPERLATMLDRHHGAHDACLQLHGTGQKMNEFCLLLGARRTVLGTTVVTARCDFGDLAMAPVDESEHEADRLTRLVGDFDGAGATQGLPPWFPMTEADVGEARTALAAASVKGPYVVMHPGASRLARRWPADRFATLASELAADGIQVIVSGGPDEVGLAGSVADAAGLGVVSLAGVLSVGGMAALLSRSMIAVSNDTGIAHLAAAVGCPVAVIFVTSDPGRWAPRGEGHIECVAPSRTGVIPTLAEVQTIVGRMVSEAEAHPSSSGRPTGVPSQHLSGIGSPA